MSHFEIDIRRRDTSFVPLKLGGVNRFGGSIGANSYHLQLQSQPWLPVMGEFHYSRYPEAFWEEALKKIRAGGVQVLATYVFWNHHEEIEGKFDFTGRRSLRRFVQLCKKHDLFVVLRIGPFCHGEVRNGGLPDWLYSKPYDHRCNDPEYLKHVRKLYERIGGEVRGLLFKEGGPIIGLQVENEFMDSVAPWETTQRPGQAFTSKGAGGTQHLNRLRDIAQRAGISCPLYFTTGWGQSPIDADRFIPMFGGYGYYGWLDEGVVQEPTGFYTFRDQHSRSSPKFDPQAVPFACCEIGGGTQVFYSNRPQVPPESVEAMHVVQLGSGSNVMGYYVYHGGTNPTGHSGYLNEHRCPRISYDFQAPIGEFGQLRPHYHLLRRQFLFLQHFGHVLAPMEVTVPGKTPAPSDIHTTRWAVRSKGNAGFLFLNNFQDHVELKKKTDVSFAIKTGESTLRIPAASKGLTIPSRGTAILPFNLELDGLRLRSSTTQPLARIVHESVPYFFFFEPPGFTAEYVFDVSTIAKVNSKPPRRGFDGVFRVLPGISRYLSLIATNGHEVRIVTLTDKQSKEFYVADLLGQKRAFLCGGGLETERNSVKIRAIGSNELEFSVFPPVNAKGTRSSRRGLFQRHRMTVRKRNVVPSVRKIGENKVAVRLPKNALQGAHEIYLSIRYVGDTSAAYLGSELIHDHFSNGSDWEIALRPFAPRILRQDLVLILTPRRGLNRAEVQHSDMAAIKVSDVACGFISVKAVCEYVSTAHCME